MLCKITNKKTKLTQLCSNADVIKACKSNPSEYTVTEVKSAAKEKSGGKDDEQKE